MPELVVSIEQDLCTSCGACPDIAPRHFFMSKDGLAYVKEGLPGTPDEVRYTGYSGKVVVAAEVEAAVIDAAEECPGECIYVELA